MPGHSQTPSVGAETPSNAGVRTYSLSEIAVILCGDDSQASTQWVTLRMRGAIKPHFFGYKARGRWRMTQVDLDAAIELLRPKRNDIHIPAMTSMTARSQRRLAV
jgi:hypothetical protein